MRDFDNMISLAQQKHDLMQEFLKLSKEQAQAISQESYAEVLNLISQKQNVIEQINVLNLDISDHMPDQNDLLNTINMQTREIMTQAVALDDKNIQSLKKNQDLIFEKLMNIKKNKQTHAQYRGENIKMEGILLDQRK